MNQTLFALIGIVIGGAMVFAAMQINRTELQFVATDSEYVWVFDSKNERLKACFTPLLRSDRQPDICSAWVFVQ